MLRNYKKKKKKGHEEIMLVDDENQKTYITQELTQELKSLAGDGNFYDNKKNYLVHPFFHKSFFIKYKLRSIKKGNFRKRDFFKIKFKDDYSFAVVFLEVK